MYHEINISSDHRSVHLEITHLFSSNIYITNLYLDINDYYLKQCQNGGTCVDGIDSYTYICPAGLTGVNHHTNKRSLSF